MCWLMCKVALDTGTGWQKIHGNYGKLMYYDEYIDVTK